MNDWERFEELESILDEIDSFDGCIIVEGKKDIRALKALGLEPEILCVQRDGGPLRMAEILTERGKEAMILTDWDDKGNILADELEHHLSHSCIRYDSDTRKRLRDICIKDIKDVESLDSLYVRLKDLYQQ